MENGEQKIFVWCDFSHEMDAAILHGLQIASILRKELCLFHLEHTSSKNSNAIAEAKLRAITTHISEAVPNVSLHFLLVAGTLKEHLDDIAERYEGILLVASKKEAPKLLPVLPQSGLPFLFTNSTASISSAYQHIILPVGYMKKCKDLALWASYLGRYNGATIELVKADEPNQNDQHKVDENLYSIEVLYEKFNFPYEIIESHKPTWKLRKAAFHHAVNHESSLLIIAHSNHSNLLDNLFGFTDLKLLKASGDMPVMCINSQRDLYTLCG